MNEAIQHAREVALDILKPSPRDIEHGMELHQNSVVCDSYGFAPRAAVDGEAVAAAVEAGASEVEVRDMMEDMSMTQYVTDERERHGVYGGVESRRRDLYRTECGGRGAVGVTSGQAFGAFHLRHRHDARLYPESSYAR